MKRRTLLSIPLFAPLLGLLPKKTESAPAQDIYYVERETVTKEGVIYPPHKLWNYAHANGWGSIEAAKKDILSYLRQVEKSSLFLKAEIHEDKVEIHYRRTSWRFSIVMETLTIKNADQLSSDEKKRIVIGNKPIKPFDPEQRA